MTSTTGPPHRDRVTATVRGARVLVVAGLELRTALRGPLGRARATLLDAVDAHDALTQASGAAPDAVVLGPRLPGAHPAELCRRLGQLRVTRGLPVLGLLDAGEDPTPLLHAGASDTLHLPLDEGVMVARLAGMVAHARTVRDAARLAALTEASALVDPPGRVEAVAVFADLRALDVRGSDDGLDALFGDLGAVMGRLGGVFSHFGGRSSAVAGDGLLAWFEGPRCAGRACRAALAARAAAMGWTDLPTWTPPPLAMGVAGGPASHGALAGGAAVLGPSARRALQLSVSAGPLEVLVEGAVLERVRPPLVRGRAASLSIRSGAARVAAWAIGGAVG